MANGYTAQNGTAMMTTGGKSPYPNLHFASHVDWKHVDPALLQKIQEVAADQHVQVDIISGYRDNKYSAANGGFANDPHTKGIAVDAYVGGKPIGDVIPTSVWQKYGVRSGNTFTYHGKTDPEHLDLYGESTEGEPGTDASPPALPPEAQTDTPQAEQDDAQAQQDYQSHLDQINQSLQQNIANIPTLGGPAVVSPAISGEMTNTQGAQPLTSGMSSTWQLIASNGNVSPDTIRLASLAGYGSDGLNSG